MQGVTTRRAAWGTWAVGAVFLVSLGSLAIAFAGEHLFGLEPCILCLYERVPYAVASIVTGIALAVPAPGVWRPRLMAAAGIVFLIGAGLAFYHVGVEQHWWRSVAACEGALATGVEDLRSLSAADLKPCDRVDWRLFGLSLAGYNVFLSLALAAVCAVGVRAMTRKA